MDFLELLNVPSRHNEMLANGLQDLYEVNNKAKTVDEFIIPKIIPRYKCQPRKSATDCSLIRDILLDFMCGQQGDKQRRQWRTFLAEIVCPRSLNTIFFVFVVSDDSDENKWNVWKLIEFPRSFSVKCPRILTRLSSIFGENLACTSLNLKKYNPGCALGDQSSDEMFFFPQMQYVLSAKCSIFSF